MFTLVSYWVQLDMIAFEGKKKMSGNYYCGSFIRCDGKPEGLTDALILSGVIQHTR